MRFVHHRHDRGSALIISMILMIVLAVVGIALVNRTTREVDAVASKRHWDRSMSCAEGARQMLMSQFRAYGVNLVNLQMQKQIGDQQYATGHYDNFNVTSVAEAGGTPGALVGGDASNRITPRGGGLGGKGWGLTRGCRAKTPGPRH